VKTRLLAFVISLLTASVLVAQTPEASSLGIESSTQQSVTVNGGNGPVFLRGAVELTVGSATISADEVEIHNTPSEALLRGTVYGPTGVRRRRRARRVPGGGAHARPPGVSGRAGHHGAGPSGRGAHPVVRCRPRTPRGYATGAGMTNWGTATI
jgi:hypothetical protein